MKQGPAYNVIHLNHVENTDPCLYSYCSLGLQQF